MIELLAALALALTQLNKVLDDLHYIQERPVLEATITAYSSSPDETWGDPFITASGKRVEQGTLACPRKYPFGTKVIIDQEIYDCRDRLALKYDDRFDIWMPSKKLALEWGKQIRVIKILE